MPFQCPSSSTDSDTDSDSAQTVFSAAVSIQLPNTVNPIPADMSSHTADHAMGNAANTSASATPNDPPLLPCEYWTYDYLRVPGIIGPATASNPQRVAEVFAARANPTVSPPLYTQPTPSASTFRVTNPERYDGSPEKLETFLRQLHMCMEFNVPSDATERQKIIYAYSCLGEKAQKRVNSYFPIGGPPRIHDLEQLCTILRLQFEDPAMQTKADAKLHGMKQGTRPFRDFLADWEETIEQSSWANVPKDGLVSSLGYKVSRKLREAFAYAAPPRDYQGFVEHCVQQEVFFEEHHHSSRTQTSTPPSQTWARMRPTRHRAPAQAPGEPMDWEPTGITNAHLRPLTARERETLRASNGCFRCRRPNAGHLARDCPGNPVPARAAAVAPPPPQPQASRPRSPRPTDEMSENGEL